MALATIQNVIDGLQPPSLVSKVPAGTGAGRIFTTWYANGNPASGGIGSATPGNALTGPVTGQITFRDPPSGETVLARFQTAYQGTSGDFMLVDRLWHMSGIGPTTLTAQTVNSAAWPARDINQSTNGDGVYVALQVTTATSTGTPSLSMTYTNSAGTGSKVGANIFGTTASTPAGSTYVMGLAAGDVGVRSVQDFTLSATWTSGALSLVAFRPIAFIPGGPAAGGPVRLRKRIEDALQLAAPRIWNGSVLELWAVPSGSTTPNIAGTISYSQG